MQEEEDFTPGTLFRAMLPTSPTSRVSNPRCKEKECDRTTREGKPYCSDHVEHSPYVRRVIEELELRDREAASLAKGGTVSPNGHLVRETLLMLEQGSYTAAKLSRLMDISHNSTETLIREMSRMGLAHLGKTDRGSLIISKLKEQD